MMLPVTQRLANMINFIGTLYVVILHTLHCLEVMIIDHVIIISIVVVVVIIVVGIIDFVFGLNDSIGSQVGRQAGRPMKFYFLMQSRWKVRFQLN